MRILAFSDMHGDVRAVAAAASELAAADLVLLAGDITHFGGRRAAAELIGELRKHNQRVLAVAGNCDTPEAATYLADEGISVHRRHVIVGGLAVAGVGGSLPCPGRTPNEISESDFARYLGEAVAGVAAATPLVLLLHQPPFGAAIDRSHSGDHVGSHAVRTFVEDRRPLLCIAGHIHEARGQDRIGDSAVVNPGMLRAGYYASVAVSDGADEPETDAGQPTARPTCVVELKETA
ncbi:MAG: metallophosphoesterase family protein [Armatimonadota bacterium]|nr:MAG: metallophosphoesterase family protein [Armatimonadota bacterium]